jgi:hypothetical protein
LARKLTERNTGAAPAAKHWAPWRLVYQEEHGDTACGLSCWTSPDMPHCGAGERMKLKVECYAGHKADERPLRFELDGRSYTVEEVLDQWYGPESTFFKVRADDGNLYILRHQGYGEADEWSLESFRSLKD